MAWQNKHPSGKPTGLSLPDLQSEAEPAAYLTKWLDWAWLTTLPLYRLSGKVRYGTAHAWR